MKRAHHLAAWARIAIGTTVLTCIGFSTGTAPTSFGDEPTMLASDSRTAQTANRKLTTADLLAAAAGKNRAEQTSSSLVTSIEVVPESARLVRLVIRQTYGGEPCIDELELYGPDSSVNLALASGGTAARASSALPGYAIHAVPHLNDGLYGNSHSWIAATAGEEWVELELPVAATINRLVFSRDRDAQYLDRQILAADVMLSSDGQNWSKAGSLSRPASQLPRPLPQLEFPLAELPEPTWNGAVTYAFLRERDTWSRMDTQDYLSPLQNDRSAYPGGPLYWKEIVSLPPLERTLVQFEQLIERLAAQALDVRAEQTELDTLRSAAQDPTAAASDELYLAARLAKRRLFFRDPRLAPLEQILFAKRHPLEPSHNYSEHMDSLFAPGGGICVLRIPRDADGRLDPAMGEVDTLFDGSQGIARDPIADFDAERIYFAYRPASPEVNGWQSYWHLYSMRTDGSELRKLTEGPYHDFDPVALPDGGLGFMTTRCAVRFLCWEPQAYVLYRMQVDGTQMQRLSFANLSEWEPAMMRDGRILWTRSEYLDKGADFGHTLWAIRPDGGHPELVFGNDTPYGYGHAREVPDSDEIVCTLISHGDHQGPIILLDRTEGLYNTAGITNITPDTRPQYQMDRSHHETFRDAEPVSRDHFLVSHNPGRNSHWSLYVIDRFGNRELLYLDPAVSSKRPTLLRKRPRPPVLTSAFDPELAAQGLGQFTVQDVYTGLGSSVAKGQAKYLQVSQEVPAPLQKLSCGEYRNTHPSFQDFYATPIHLVAGPSHSYLTRVTNALQPHAFRNGSAQPEADGTALVTENHGWPSFVAKAVLGVTPVAEDGSANFTAPAGRVLYFQLLDENFNELQRMRSVIQLQPGERRSCVGCHDNRTATPTPAAAQSLARRAQALEPPPWGAVAFDYERLLQPVWDAQCVRCHDLSTESKFDLRGTHDAAKVPASYRSLIAGGWVHYFDWSYGARHFKAEPLSFGTLQSRLFTVLADDHHKDVALTRDQRRVLTAWIDLNCPLWPDYQFRPERPQ